MTMDEKDAVIDHLIDVMAELITLETRVRVLRLSIEPVANNLYPAHVNRKRPKKGGTPYQDTANENQAIKLA